MIVSNKKVFIDTNILYYTNNSSSEFGKQALLRINELHQSDNALFISSQILKEYANATLRNVIYHKLDLPSNIQIVSKNIKKFQRDFNLLHDDLFVFQSWLKLLPRLRTNKDIFDFNIAATLQANDINYILTNNVSDFIQFEEWLNVLPLFPKSI